MEGKYSSLVSVILISILYISLHYMIYGYPLFFRDSVIYITQSFNGQLKTYGSIFYPMFLKLFSQNKSLWPVIITQTVLSVYTLNIISKLIFKNRSTLKFILLSTTLIFSTLFLFTNTIITDVFLGVSILLNFYIFRTKISIKNIPIYLLFSITILGHNGFIYVILLINLTVLLYTIIKRTNFINIALIFALIVMSKLLITPMIKFGYKHQETSRRVSVECRFLNNINIAKTFLPLIESQCPYPENNVFCKKIAKVRQQNGVKRGFRAAGINFDTTTEYDDDCAQVLKSAIFSGDFKYILKGAYINYLRLCGNFNAYVVTRKNNTVTQIKKRFRNDFGLNNSVYINGGVSNKMSFFRQANNSILIISFILLIPLFYLNRKSNIILELLLYIILGIILSTLFYALFSNPGNSRYVSRITWLIPFIVVCMLLKLDELKDDNFISKYLSNTFKHKSVSNK